MTVGVPVCRAGLRFHALAQSRIVAESLTRGLWRACCAERQGVRHQSRRRHENDTSSR